MKKAQMKQSILSLAIDKVKPYKLKAYLGTVVYMFVLLAPLFLSAIHYMLGAIVFALLFGIMTINYIKFMRNVLDGKDVTLSMLFKVDGNFASMLFLGVLYLMMLALGMIILILPGILVISYYSMSIYVMERENSKSVFETMNITASAMKGNKVNMLNYKVLFYILYLIVVIVVSLLFVIAASLASTMSVLLAFLNIVILLLALAALSFITIYFTTANIMFFDSFYNKDKTTVKTVAVSEEVVEKVKENKEVEEKEVVEAKEVKETKQTPKQTPTKPKTQTTPSANKNTPKKTTKSNAKK